MTEFVKRLVIPENATPLPTGIVASIFFTTVSCVTQTSLLMKVSNILRNGLHVCLNFDLWEQDWRKCPPV